LNDISDEFTNDLTEKLKEAFCTISGTLHFIVWETVDHCC